MKYGNEGWLQPHLGVGIYGGEGVALVASSLILVTVRSGDAHN